MVNGLLFIVDCVLFIVTLSFIVSCYFVGVNC